MNTEAEILFFGSLAEVTGVNSIRLWEVTDTDSIKNIIEKRYPLLMGHSYVLALDKELIHKNHVLRGTHTIAFMPPFSGG